VVAIGCTGGKHRSVAIAEQLAASVSALSGGDAPGDPGRDVRVTHRDLGRE
jgi:UPF0042 nucleotide-binding protein